MLWGLDTFLGNQIGCGNLPVQFVGTKVAFVTQITATYLLVEGELLGAGKGVGRQVQASTVGVAPWWGVREQAPSPDQRPGGQAAPAGDTAWGSESSRSLCPPPPAPNLLTPEPHRFTGKETEAEKS